MVRSVQSVIYVHVSELANIAIYRKVAAMSRFDKQYTNAP